MRVGQDVMGTMAATLILAVFGGIGVILTVPIAAGCSAFLLAHKRASVHETSPFQIG